MTKTLEQIRIAKTVKGGENSLKLFKVSGDRRLDQNQNNIKLEHLPRNFEESYEWLKYLFENEAVQSKLEQIIKNSNKTKSDILDEAVKYAEVRYELNCIEDLISKGKRDFWATKEKCLVMFSKIGFYSKNIEMLDNEFLIHPINAYELERLYLILAGLWDAIISNQEEMLMLNLKKNGVKNLPGYLTNQVPVLDFFLRNFEVINKYTEFFRAPWCPDSLKFYKNYAIIALTECRRKGIYSAIRDEKVKQVIDEFVQMFVKPNDGKTITVTNNVMPKTNGTYDVLKKMSDEIVIPWPDKYILDPVEGTYKNLKTGNILVNIMN